MSLAPGPPNPSPLTPRAIFLGVVLAIGFAVAGSIALLLRYEIIGTGYLPRGVVCLLLLIVGGNAVLRLLRRRGLSRGEILMVYVMLAGMAAVPGQEFGQHFYLNTLGIVYYTTPDIAPPDLYLRDLNPNLVPSVDREAPVIRWAFEGLPPGATTPWRPWVIPLLLWTPYFFALYWMLLCVAALMSRRWEQQERLVYPLVQVPVELADDGGGIISPLFKNWLLWICFLFGVSLYVIKGLHTYYPAVPDLNLQRHSGPLFGGGSLVAFNYMPLHFYPEMVGIAYLLSAEVAFSLWFFYLSRLTQTALRMSVGLRADHYQFAEMQTVGGYLVLGLALLWSSRHYLREVYEIATGRRDSRGGSGERLAFYGCVASLAFLLWWSWQVGLAVPWAAILIIPFALVSLVVSRVISEAGMFIYSSPFRYDQLLFRLLGPKYIGAGNVTLMTMMSWVQVRGTATQFMPQAFQCLKIGSLSGAPRGKLMWATMGSVAAAILVGHVALLTVIYKWSVLRLGWWPKGSGLSTTNLLVSDLRAWDRPSAESWIAIALGAGFTAFLVSMRYRLLWWPFHPLGYVAWLGWPTDRYWLSIFFGWLIKTIVVRFFGYKVFASLRPAAFGLILGICVILTFWIVFHFFVPGPELVTE